MNPYAGRCLGDGVSSLGGFVDGANVTFGFVLLLLMDVEADRMELVDAVVIMGKVSFF